MDAGSLMIVFLPGVISLSIHERLLGDARISKNRFKLFATYALYALAINISCALIKLLRGSENVDYLFQLSSNVLKYGLFALVLSVAYPYIVHHTLQCARRIIANRTITVTPEFTVEKQLELAARAKARMRKSARELIKICALLAILIGAGFIFMLLAYQIPAAPMQKNTMTSAETIREEGTYNYLVKGWESTRQDNFTDAQMLLIASYDGAERLVDRAMTNYYYRFSGENPSVSLVKLKDGALEGLYTAGYARYWHGYLILLKPALLLLTYGNIRLLNAAAHLLLIGVVIWFFIKRGRAAYILPFITALFCLTLPAVFRSMQYSATSYIFLIAILVHLVRGDALNKKSYRFFYLCVGAATSYFDLLIYPAATFAFPFLTLVLLTEEKDWKTALKQLIVCGVYWSAGYLGMWASKWILATLLTQHNVIENAVGELMMRSATQTSGGDAITYREVLKKNIDVLMKWPYLAFVGIALMDRLIRIYHYAFDFSGKKLTIAIQPRKFVAELVIYLSLAILPFAWFFVTQNHAEQHPRFTSRTLTITIYALLSMLTGFYTKPKSGVKSKRSDTKGVK